MIMKKFLYAFLVLLCSCEGDIAQDGIVKAVEQEINYGYKYKVRVEKSKNVPEIYGGKYYWFWTNDTFFVGDTIHIGKVIQHGKKDNTIYYDLK